MATSRNSQPDEEALSVVKPPALRVAQTSLDNDAALE